MSTAFLRKLAGTFGWTVRTLPEDYRPAGWAFLHSIVNDQPDSEREVPQEILPTIALAVLSAVLYPYNNPYGDLGEITYEKAKKILNQHNSPVPVRAENYPTYQGSSYLLGYDRHPHYYVLGAFMAKPLGNGMWEIADRYDWHFPTNWLVPECIAKYIPKWILSKFCKKRGKLWYLEEVGALDQLTVPYWHRSITKLSDYLTPDNFKLLYVEEDEWLI